MAHAINSKSVNEVLVGMSIGSQLRHIRKVQGLTQGDLAQKLGTGQGAISRVENDSYLPSLSFLIRVAEILQKHIEVKIK